MSNKKKTAMQDLRQDLSDTIDSTKDALKEIKKETTRLACQELVRITLKNIIQRIDEELLELENQQKDDLAVEFAEFQVGLLTKQVEGYFYYDYYAKWVTTEQLLEIFKKEKGW